jgi:hypothetical protein
MKTLLGFILTLALLNSCETITGKPVNKGTFEGDIAFTEYTYKGSNSNPTNTRFFRDTITHTMWEDKEGLYLNIDDNKYYFGAENIININKSLPNGTEKIQIIRKTGSFDYSHKINTANDTAEFAVLGSGILSKK